ncbi:MAG: hypothetical protein C0606_00410 [Hyphomicrobiales bacterium]|nr:MAG: hypothetical protein C0606_00410 [Hyphomicrobiales bacterium]
MSLIRTAFWLCLLIAVLPIEPDTSDNTAQTDISTWEAIGAAQSIYSDISGFCERNPATCETGQSAANAFSNKAKASAKALYEYLNDDETAAPAPVPASTEPAGKVSPAPTNPAQPV